jgi:glyoxylase-like metal-dependent hydrolase (beta-lactamase superfamily II)
MIIEEDGVTLVDTCKEKHSHLLLQALNEFGKPVEDFKLVLATHGHKDHIEGANMFRKAKKVIHPEEDGKGLNQFDPELADLGTIKGFDYCPSRLSLAGICDFLLPAIQRYFYRRLSFLLWRPVIKGRSGFKRGRT